MLTRSDVPRSEMRPWLKCATPPASISVLNVAFSSDGAAAFALCWLVARPLSASIYGQEGRMSVQGRMLNRQKRA